jgi:hypothetical protein
LILATHGEPVMAMGGFSGGDPAPTTTQLESLVQTGALRFILEGGGGFGGAGGGPFGPGRGAFQAPAAQTGIDGDGAATVSPPFGTAPLPPMVPGQPGVGFGIVGPGPAPVGQAPGPAGFGQGDGRGAGRFGRAGGFVGGPTDVPAIPSSGPGNGPVGGPPTGGGFGGGMGPGGRVDAALIEYLEANRGSADYLVAVNSSMAASPIILQTGAPVMAMGGFSGGDPAPTAGQLARMVADGKLRFVMGGGRMGGGPGRGPGGGVAGERAAWVEANCQAVDPFAYGEPRDAGDQSAQVGRGFGRGGEQQLFDCAPGLAAVTDQPGG